MAEAVIPETRKNARPHLTASEYLEQVNNLAKEVESAIAIYQAYEEVQRLGLNDNAVFQALNRDALFWNIHRSCLVTSLFIALARIFDTNPDAHSVQRLLNITLAQPELFSKSALAARKTTGASKPEWLDEFIERAWEPNGAGDLRHLKKKLGQYVKKFEQVYRPIRHNIYAHRLVTDDGHVSALFAQTNRAEIGTILDFLDDLTQSLWHLYQNGVKPALGQRAEYHNRHNEAIREGVRKVLLRLV
jgi:hypothetical protein